jgi:hypothetical protein
MKTNINDMLMQIATQVDGNDQGPDDFSPP